MNRIDLTKNTQLGLDIYQGDEIEYLLGVESKPSDKWKIKAKIGSLSDFELALRYSPLEELKFIFGLKGEYHEEADTKQGCSVGFGCEATFK
mmetsp:Transcript_8180/g.7260  ORF Transcript_8180/g.7260 Transcript_8180/m.7260 type:complete len:92 (+) Transcript_8180:619-894(+)